MILPKKRLSGISKIGKAWPLLFMADSFMISSRSRFYDRKKEAVMAFGIALWGYYIPKAKEEVKDSQDVLTEGSMAVE